MKLFFGYNQYELSQHKKEIPVIWDSDMVATRHMLIMGQSGSGKTYTLRNIINQLKNQNKNTNFRIHVFDFHGDIDLEGSSSVKFSATTDYGFNPLIINPDLDFGGVRNKIQSFIGLINSSGRSLGPKQESVLRNLLLDLYAANGFYVNKPETWQLNDGMKRKYPKKHPTLQDAIKFSTFKLQSLMLGSDNRAMSLLEQLNKSAVKLYSKLKYANKEQIEIEKAKTELSEAKSRCIEEYTQYVNSIDKGTELSDLMKYDSKDVMKSVVERLENLYNCGIFKEQQPPFDTNSTVWRYDIKALRLEEKKMFVNMLLEQIFERRKQAGVESDLKEIVVVDEAHIYFNDDPENIINMIAKEARKFGMGLICASQSPEHFSDDFVTNVGCNIITGIHEKFWAGSSKKLNINPKMFGYIVMQKNMLVQIKNKGVSGSNFILACFKK